MPNNRQLIDELSGQALCSYRHLLYYRHVCSGRVPVGPQNGTSVTLISCTLAGTHHLLNLTEFKKQIFMP